MQKILLLGYMGSGKSVVGQSLSQKLAIPFLDLDREIEKQEGKSIRDIFEAKGEIYFRKVEHTLFIKLLQSDSGFVLALGGGTPCYANNHLQLKRPDSVSVYLKASIQTLSDRLESEVSARPLLRNNQDADLSEFIAKHLFDRSFYYNHANLKITVDNKSVNEIVSEIILRLA